MQQTHPHKAVTGRVEAKKLLSRRRQSEYRPTWLSNLKKKKKKTKQNKKKQKTKTKTKKKKQNKTKNQDPITESKYHANGTPYGKVKVKSLETNKQTKGLRKKSFQNIRAIEAVFNSSQWS